VHFTVVDSAEAILPAILKAAAPEKPAAEEDLLEKF